MKVILKKDISNLGKTGEIKTVRDGYGRNFLMPRGLVEAATPGAMKAWKNSESKRTKRVAAENSGLQELAKKISAVTLSFSRPVSEEGAMFGSVAKSDIIKNLAAADIEVHKDMIKLPASIKAVGVFEVEVALKPEITAKVKITVTAQTK
ncbi:MAG: 50S ribosomal protein L9 [Elusimicrobia bacterium GWA2_56_46]|nr:MAG: 50S ribosomal protein L9 [Elusimicrobia bacterium GWA2_56_46]OGR54665.1 MAG: 50S ribosomal protein L9 [Elusimicrobia bacterium GWC2_56_31]HBB66765.1 50S ribosomal protein L9 [Elusimicrobiota bacterium]HBW21977.1 50S ribosomal protein L9 [Elusimicrobiota bacterium]